MKKTIALLFIVPVFTAAKSQSSAVILDVVNVVPDYRTAHNTSDHYPVF
jgi:hypothetical protein